MFNLVTKVIMFAHHFEREKKNNSVNPTSPFKNIDKVVGTVKT